MTTERKQNPVDPSKVQQDEILMFTYYTKVSKIESNGSKLGVFDLDVNREMAIVGAELVASSLSADQFSDIEKVSKTEAAQLLVYSAGKPFTVCFKKSDGTPRTIRGRLVKHEALLGRSMVEDLDKNPNDRLRQIDHRTIEFIVVEGVKYIVK